MATVPTHLLGNACGPADTDCPWGPPHPPQRSMHSSMATRSHRVEAKVAGARLNAGPTPGLPELCAKLGMELPSLAALVGLGWGKFRRTKPEPGQSRAPGVVPARASGREPPCWGLQEFER